MSTTELQTTISSLINSSSPCRVYFKPNDSRNVIYGYFVNIEDSKDLRLKGMVRFVNAGAYESFLLSSSNGSKHINSSLTRIYKISDFMDIKI